MFQVSDLLERQSLQESVRGRERLLRVCQLRPLHEMGFAGA